jgi:signal transduction histidine kinase
MKTDDMKQEAEQATHLVKSQQEELLSTRELIRQLLNAVPMPLLVINRAWQVVYANTAVLEMLATSGAAAISGLREGEEFHCIHGRPEDGEDAAPSCRICGVARAVAVALNGEGSIRDCRLTCDLAGEAHSLDLRAWATPLVIGEETLSVLVLADISHEKRRVLLENVYFHDLLNTLTGIRGLLDVLSHSDVSERPEICGSLDRMTLRSIEEIDSLRLLAQAEDCSLQVVWADLDTGSLLEEVVSTLRCHPSARGKMVILDTEMIDVSFCSDRRLLRRVVENMLLNALEATECGGSVSLGCWQISGHVNFWVHNNAWMPDEIQLQVFQRSFSTKGQQRGIGTYSIKLLSSHILGTVNFTSTPESGTVFQASFPLRPHL